MVSSRWPAPLTGDLMLASRVVSIAFGLLLVVAVWGIGRRFGGDLGGGLAAILCATHPLVVLLSATALVDICYVSMVLCGFSFYLRFAESPTSPPIDLFAACGMMTIACAFHYNAWIVVLVFVALMLRDLYRGDLPRRLVVGGLFVLGSWPCVWVAWNWRHFGSPLAFLTRHKGYSESFWLHSGYRPSLPGAIAALMSIFWAYSPLLMVVAFAGVGMLLTKKSGERRPVLLWTMLASFLAGLVFLYATGGRPAAYEPRYILLPSVLMILIASESVSRLWGSGDRGVRAFGFLLSVGLILVNFCMFHRAVDDMKKASHTEFSIEARRIAAYMHDLKSQNAPRMVLEVKLWNYLALQVYLNRVDAVVLDRKVLDDPIRTFDNPSILLGDRETVLGQLMDQNVRFIAAWSPAVQDHIETWGLQRLAQVDSYRIYQIPRGTVVPAPAAQ